MVRKRAILYFLLMGFPVGLGAGATSWIHLPVLIRQAEEQAPVSAVGEPVDTPTSLLSGEEPETPLPLPDLAKIHPLVVGAFCLLFCMGVLIAAEPVAVDAAKGERQGDLDLKA